MLNEPAARRGCDQGAQAHWELQAGWKTSEHVPLCGGSDGVQALKSACAARYMQPLNPRTQQTSAHVTPDAAAF